MFYKIKKWYMGLINKNEDINTKNEDTNLTIEELEYLFNLIKKSNFPGTDLQVIYHIIIKLQKLYISMKK